MYVEVIIPVSAGNTYTYCVPPELQNKIKQGCLVLVEFGRKHYSGIVADIRMNIPPPDFQIKPILLLESEEPVVRSYQLQFWDWLADYYLCTRGEVYKAVLPSGFRSERSSKYKPKTETYIRLAPDYLKDEEALLTSLEKMKRAPKQEKLLLEFLDRSGSFSEQPKEVSKKKLVSDKSKEAALTALIKKEILEIYEKEVSRLHTQNEPLISPHVLNIHQEEAYSQIKQGFLTKNVCLLHGITAAGKTEIYIQLISETLAAGKQALFLLPEIALTAQITYRLKKVFGNKIGVYHSKINDNERVEIWNNLLYDEGYQIILGVRSSIFLPFRELGLIVVDEEHEPGYKQQDPAPRYHARNAAIVLATLHQAKVLLGSATPSMESYHNARSDKYAYVKLDKRFETGALPEIVPVDIRELKRKKRMKTLFSPLLIEKMNHTLAAGEQIILFQNRRGFAPMTFCKVCDWVPKCACCDVSLNYHKQLNRLVCHYCGTTYPCRSVCPECGNDDLRPRGFGTEKVEEEIRSLFPNIQVARMDTDTTRHKNAYEKIIDEFDSGRIRVLIGTQMVSKGLDFENVSLVGILNAESMMNFPDFRSHERAFQLMLQVAGRAGRRNKKGEVILQTSHPEHPLIQFVLERNYEGMYLLQSEERYLFRYPPFFRLIEITFKHKKENIADGCSRMYADLLKPTLGDRVLGPDKPVIGRIQSYYLRRILVKMDASASGTGIRNLLKHAVKQLSLQKEFKYVIIQYDVDPV